MGRLKKFRLPFPEMHEILPEVETEEIRIKHYRVDDADSRFAMMRAMMNGDPFGGTDPARTYCRLGVKTEKGWVLMMSDTDLEHRTNARFLYNATGDVLIAGLGLGMIVHPLLEKPDIRSVTIIEKYQAVIDAVGHTLDDPRVRIIHADIDTWTPDKATVYDTIYFDIWPTRSENNFPQINRLHRRFRKFLRDPKTSWIGSWWHAEAKMMRERERRANGRYA